MKKPDDNCDSDFSEFMWMAEDGADEGLQQQVEEEMELIEQDFLEAMFEDLLREEDEQQVYYGPPDTEPNQVSYQNSKANYSTMQLPKIQSQLNPNAPEFVPRFATAAASS